MTPILATDRLHLRPFTRADLSDFTALHSDPGSMRDHGLTLTPRQSAEKLTSYLEIAAMHGIGRFHVSDATGFIGYVGINAAGRVDHPLGRHHEIGWRLLPKAWGKGYATEAAQAALRDAFARLPLTEVLAYTAPDNKSSQAVMARLGLTRRPEMDFKITDPLVGNWTGLVWAVRSSDQRAGGTE